MGGVRLRDAANPPQELGVLVAIDTTGLTAFDANGIVRRWDFFGAPVGFPHPETFFATTDCNASATYGLGTAYVWEHALPSTQMFYRLPTKPDGVTGMLYPELSSTALPGSFLALSYLNAGSNTCHACGGGGCPLAPNNPWYVLRDVASVAGWSALGSYSARAPFVFE